MIYVLDTDICSYAIRKDALVVRNIILHERDSLCISAISYAELLFGAHKRKSPRLLAAVRNLIDRFRIINFDKDCARQYAVIREYLEARGLVIGSMDMLIAATALSLQGIVVTNNEKHYQNIPDLQIEDWSIK
jgi:predicted nucleic acid-binding protein